MSNKENNHNFWIAYADLMAGLMFIFILLIGMIVVKYVLSQEHLSLIKQKLDDEEKSLIKSKEDLAKKEKIVGELGEKLEKTYNELLSEQNKKKELEKIIDEHTKNEEILSKTYIMATKELEKTSNKLQEIISSVDEKDKQILVLLDDLSQKEDKIKQLTLHNEQITGKINNILNKNVVLVENLQKHLDGVKLDSSGTLSLPSTVLFDSGAYMLKQDAKEELQKTLSKYFDAILNDENLYDNIENIIIEGHTDSDGSYIYNLELSQKRAYEVMSFIYSFNSDKRLQKLLMASGRSFSSPIIINGKEDKEASRRIEIKIIFSNKNINKEIQEYFNHK